MPTITTVDMAWQPSPTTFTDAEARRFDTAMFLGDGSANGVRGGVVRHGDTSLAVSVNGSDQVTVQAGAVVIPAATGLGVYRGALAAATSAVGIDARNGTNPRIDLVVFRTTGAVDIIAGTPGSSPSAPALPAQTVELARLAVPKVGGGAVTVDSTWRAYACTLGGTLHVETSARLPGSGNQKGQRAVALDTGLGHTWNGTAWVCDLIRAEVSTSANVVVNDSTATTLLFNAEVEDVGITAGSYNPATGLYTCPFVGLYRVEAGVAFESDPDGRRAVIILKNGSVDVGRIIQTDAVATDVTYLTLSREFRCAAGDTLGIRVLHTAGSARWVLPGSMFAVRKVA